MLCIDGSDGKGNAFQLHPIFDDAQSHLCQWSSSDATKATVSSTGVVTGVSAGNVMISCTHLGVNKSCKFTIYRTLPDEMTLAQLPGGNAYVNFFALTDERPSARFAFVKKNPTIPYPFGMWISVAGSWTIYSAGNFENSPMRLRYVTTTEYQDYATTAPPQQHRVNAYEIIGVENPLMNAQFTVDGIPVELGKSYYTTASGSYHAPDLMPYILDDGNYPAIKPISVSSDHSRLAQFVDLRDRTKVSQMAVYQNYIRYADHDGIVNRTVLPNMGYGGSQYNLESNGTVPNEWFGDSI